MVYTVKKMEQEYREIRKGSPLITVNGVKGLVFRLVVNRPLGMSPLYTGVLEFEFQLCF